MENEICSVKFLILGRAYNEAEWIAEISACLYKIDDKDFPLKDIIYQ